METNRCIYLYSQLNLTCKNELVPQPAPSQVLIKIAANGICGSDLHFYNEGRLGNFRVTSPYIPGHEASGTVVRPGEQSGKFKIGDNVVIEPGIPCGKCGMCKSGRYNLCPEVVFLSAPPVDGTKAGRPLCAGGLDTQ
jgi:L-iditol 2-dehydrogenase